MFLKQDFSKSIKYPDDFFYKYTNPVPGDGNCGIYSMALELGICKDPKELTQQNIADLRKRFYETAKKIGCTEEEQKNFKEYKAWVRNTALPKVLSVEAQKPCLLFCPKYSATGFLSGFNGKSPVFPYRSEFSLCDLMLNMDDMPIVFMNTNHFQPLTRKDELKRREAVILIINNLFYSSLRSFKNYLEANLGKVSWIAIVNNLKLMVLKALLPIQKANQIEKNIDEILNVTPEADKLSVLLAIAEELCQEFNSIFEKFKANELKLEKNNDDVEPQKTEEEKNQTDTHEQKNNSDQNNNAKSEQLENEAKENETNEHNNKIDTKEKNNPDQNNNTKSEQLENEAKEKNKTNESACDKQEEKNKSDQETIKKLDTLLEKTQTLEEFDKDVHKLYEQNNQASVILDKADKKTHSVFNKNKSSSVFYRIGKDTKSRQKELIRLKKYFIICIVFSNMPYKDKKDMIAKVKRSDKASVFRYILNVLKNFFTGKIAAAFSPKIIQSLDTLCQIEEKICKKKLSESQKSDNQRAK